VSTDLKARIKADLIVARKARDRLQTTVLSTLLADLRNREIDGKRELKEEEIIGAVAKAIKQRRDVALQMRAAERGELADGEEAEADVLAKYLPVQLTEEEIREMVRAAIAGGADAIGPLMGRIMPQIKGRFDGQEANRIVREELAASS
jgi:uncharacterized protein YqeY